MSQLFALVPVRVRISSNSAAEIHRAQGLVRNVVEFWQETCVMDWNDNGPEEGSRATCVEEQPSYLFPREPSDTITVVTDGVNFT